MSDVTMMGWLCVADFGQAMPSLELLLAKSWQIPLLLLLPRSRPKPRLFAAETPNTTLLAISFPPCVPNEGCQHDGVAIMPSLALSLAKSLADSTQIQTKTKVVCS
jgi:hypothetical protein